MRNNERHLTREELLLFLDREMNAEVAVQAEAHLAQCAKCSTALTGIGVVLKQVDGVCGVERFGMRKEDGQRALLQTRLRHVAISGKRRWGWSPLQPTIYVAAMVLMVIFSLGWVQYHATQQPPYSEGGLVPNPHLTPGAVKQVTYEEICPAPDDDKDPVVTAEVRQAVFKEYGVSQAPRTRKFQIDYLINPQLGGTGAIRNLWPQPNDSTVWNAHAKDALEDQLHAMVCRREIDLPEAQREIAADWIGAYKKYFHTQAPLHEQAKFAEMNTPWLHR